MSYDGWALMGLDEHGVSWLSRLQVLLLRGSPNHKTLVRYGRFEVSLAPPKKPRCLMIPLQIPTNSGSWCERVSSTRVFGASTVPTLLKGLKATTGLAEAYRIDESGFLFFA